MEKAGFAALPIAEMNIAKQLQAELKRFKYY